MAYATSDPAAVRALLASDPEWTYVDVRTVEEFEAGHVPGAYNVPLLLRSAHGLEPNPDFAAAVARHFGPERKLVLGCKAGGRSQRACELLERSGYAHLVNMAGGFHGATDGSGRVLEPGWAARGFESTRESRPGRSWRELARA
jgi:rhodanese-related sulfurtransferase